MIGLEDTLNTLTVSFDLGYQTISGINYNTRNLIQKNFYVADIIFDAKSRPMTSNSNSASSSEYYIHITSRQDDVMFDNVTIQNVNNTSFSSNKNVTINILNGQRVLFNQVTLKNVTPKSGLAPIQVNNGAKDVYFNNLILDNVYGNHSSTFKPFIKFENGSTVIDDLKSMTTYFTGNLTQINMNENDKQIYVENYLYDTLAFPSDQYRYAQLRNQNGSWTIGYIILSQTMPVTNNNYAIFDMRDNSFVVKEGGAISEKAQIQTIIDTVSFIRKIKDLKTDINYNIKYEVGTNIGDIDLPEIKPSTAAFQSSYAGFFEGIHFNIIPVTAGEIAVFDNTVDSIKLHANSVANYALYNIDFDETSKLTIKEVIEVIGAIIEVDPNIALYPTGTASKLLYSEYFTDKTEEIEFSAFETFKNYTFISLVNKIEFITVPTGPFYVGNTIDLEVQLKNERSNSFTIADVLNEDINKNTSNDEVPLVKWF